MRIKIKKSKLKKLINELFDPRTDSKTSFDVRARVKAFLDSGEADKILSDELKKFGLDDGHKIKGIGGELNFMIPDSSRLDFFGNPMSDFGVLLVNGELLFKDFQVAGVKEGSLSYALRYQDDHPDVIKYNKIRRAYMRSFKKIFAKLIKPIYDKYEYRFFHIPNFYERTKVGGQQSIDQYADFFGTSEEEMKDMFSNSYGAPGDNALEFVTDNFGKESKKELSVVYTPANITNLNSVIGDVSTEASKGTQRGAPFVVEVQGYMTTAFPQDTMTTTVKDAFHQSSTNVGGSRQGGQFVKYPFDSAEGARARPESFYFYRKWVEMIEEGNILSNKIEKYYRNFLEGREQQLGEATIDNWQPIRIYSPDDMKSIATEACGLNFEEITLFKEDLKKVRDDFMKTEKGSQARIESISRLKDVVTYYRNVIDRAKERLASFDNAPDVEIYSIDNMENKITNLKSLLSELFSELIELSRLNTDLLRISSNPNLKENLSRGSLYRKNYWGRY